MRAARALPLLFAVVLLGGCQISLSRTRFYARGFYPLYDTATEEAAGRDAAPPGTLFGVDLRGYQHIVFIVDVSMNLCRQGPPLPPDTAPYTFASAEDDLPIDALGRRLVAALEGLPGTTRYSILLSSGGTHLHFLPGAPPWGHGAPSESGGAARAMAAQLLSTMICHGMGTGTLTWSLRRAFDEKPDVVVVLSDTLGSYRPVDRDDALANLPESRPTYASPLDELPRWPTKRPVIAIRISPIGRQFHPLVVDSTEPGLGDPMTRLAEETGGTLVHGGNP